METMMEHIATTLNKDPTEIRARNLYHQGQMTPGGMTLTYCSIDRLLQQLEQTAGVRARQEAVQEFNKVGMCSDSWIHKYN